METIERKISIESIKEEYDKLYPVEMLIDNTNKCVEAIGFLNAIGFFCPLLEGWTQREMAIIKLAIILNANESEV